MLDRRTFVKNLAGIFVAAQAPTIFLPKLIKPRWKVPINLSNFDIELYHKLPFYFAKIQLEKTLKIESQHWQNLYKDFQP